MTILESLFSELASQFVPGSIYAPKAPVLNTMEDHQMRSSANFTKPIWTPVVNNEEVTEFLIVADGDAQFAETLVDTIVASSYSMSAATLAGSATTLSASAAKGATSINVTDATGIIAGDYIVLDVMGSDVRKRELIKVDSVSSNTLVIGTTKPEGLMVAHASGGSVQEVTLTAKTETTDYTIDIATGEITLLDGQFAAGQLVFLKYTSVNTSFSHYKVYRGTTPNSFSTAALAATATAKSTTTVPINHLSQADEGETFYYWVTAIDAEGNESRPAKVENSTCYSSAFDTIPTMPQDLQSTVTAGASAGKVNLFWNAIIDGNTNLDGFDVYRKTETWSTSATSPALLERAPGGRTAVSYEDPTVLVGNTYFYRIVAVDDISANNTTDSDRRGNVTDFTETKTTKTVN